MAKLPAINLFPGDWLRDSVAGCSLAAQGLWLRMMFVMHDSDRYGYLSTLGVPMPPEHTAQRCGTPLDYYTTLLAELDRAGVPSRDERGTIYSRRMVRDAKRREQSRKNGRKGGNPKLLYAADGDDNSVIPPINHPHNPTLKMKEKEKNGEGGPGEGPGSDADGPRQASALAAARSFASGWITANYPMYLRKIRSFVELIQAVGKDRAVQEVELVIASDPTIRDPFAYAKAILSDAKENPPYRASPARKSITKPVAFGEM